MADTTSSPRTGALPFLTQVVIGTAAGSALLLTSWAAIQLWRRPHVREFQAGEPSGTLERLTAWVQRSGVEVAGFTSLALLLGLLSLAAAPLLKRRAAGDPRAARRGALLLAVGAAVAWTSLGTYYAGEWLPHLTPLELLALNALGLVLPLIGLLVLAKLAGLLPGGRRANATALALGASVAGAAAAYLAVRWLQAAEPTWKTPLGLGGAALIALGSLPAAALLAGLTDEFTRPSPQTRSQARPSSGLRAGRALLLAHAGVMTLGAGLLYRPTQTEIPAYEGQTSAAEPGLPNVLFVVIDTLRADALSSYGYDRPTSPNLDALADRGVRFADAMSPAAWTKPSTGTLLTGLYPSRHGALHHGSVLQIPEGERALAEVFQDAGYATAAFVTNPNIKRIFAFDRGFSDFFDSPVEDTVSLASIRDSVFGRLLIRWTRHQFNWKYENDAAQMNAHVLPWLERNATERFFLYVHYIDPHSPYSPPAEYRREFAGDHGLPLHNERKRLVGRDLYDGEIRFVDEQVGLLFARLEELGLADETLICVTSDHGEEWFEFDVLGHGFSLYQPVIHVPLILAGPGLPEGAVVEAPVETVDLAATLVDAAGLGLDALGDGTSMLPKLDPTAPADRLFLENEFGMEQGQDSNFVLHGVREGPWKLILTDRSLYRPPGDDYPGFELFRVDRDPAETENLFEDPENRERIEAMLGALGAHKQFLSEFGARDGEQAELSADIQSQLEALGYTGH